MLAVQLPQLFTSKCCVLAHIQKMEAANGNRGRRLGLGPNYEGCLMLGGSGNEKNRDRHNYAGLLWYLRTSLAPERSGVQQQSQPAV
jgi:hypothetical protein